MNDTDMRRRSVRTKTLSVLPRDDGGFDFETRLTDRSFLGDYEQDGDDLIVHDFVLSGALDDQLVLRSIDVEAREHPFNQCPLMSGAVSELIGESVLAGWRRTVLERFSATRGCTHTTTLLLGLSEVITLVYFQRMNRLAAYGPKSRESGEWIAGSLRSGQPLAGACHVLDADGMVIGEAERFLRDHSDRSHGGADHD